jgi:hypothetical protein
VNFMQWWKVSEEKETSDDAWSAALTVISVEVKGQIRQSIRDN